MNLLIITFFVYFALCLFSLIISKYNFLSPSVLFTGSFTLFLFISIFYQKEFSINLKFDTFLLMAISGALFVLTEIGIRFLYNKKNINKKQSKEKTAIRVDPVVSYLALGIMIALLIFAIYVLLINTNGYSLQERIKELYHLSAYRGRPIRLFGIRSQFDKLAKVLAYVFIYIAMYNIMVCHKSISSEAKHILIGGLYLIYVYFTTGARQGIVDTLLYMMLVWLIVSVQSQRVNILKTVMICGGVVLLGATVFIVMWPLLDRGVNGQSIRTYVGTYAAGGVCNLNTIVGTSIRHPYWGSYTFCQIYAFLSKFGIVPASYAITINPHKIELGRIMVTTVTIFGRWYQDFGHMGTYIISCLVSAFYSVFYYFKIYNHLESSPSHIIYALFSVCLLWAGYDDRIQALISVGNIIICTLIVLTYYFVTKVDLQHLFVKKNKDNNQSL